MLTTRKKYLQLKKSADTAENQLLERTIENVKLRHRNHSLKEALNQIIEQETKAPNATVTRMVNIAKDALAELKILERVKG